MQFIRVPGVEGDYGRTASLWRNSSPEDGALSTIVAHVRDTSLDLQRGPRVVSWSYPDPPLSLCAARFAILFCEGFPSACERRSDRAAAFWLRPARLRVPVIDVLRLVLQVLIPTDVGSKIVYNALGGDGRASVPLTRMPPVVTT